MRPLARDSPPEDHAAPTRVVLMHRTKASGLRWLQRWSTWSTGHRGRCDRNRGIHGPRRVYGRRRHRTRADAAAREAARLRVVARTLGAGVAVTWRSGLAEAKHSRLGGLLAEQRQYLDDFWDRADVEIAGDTELQQAVRFALFHTLQAGARAERRAIAAKGLTGPVTTVTRSGTPRLSCCRCSHTPTPRGRRRLAMATRHARPSTQARAAAWPQGRGVPMADDPWRGVLGVLAGRHGRLPHQR